MFDYPSFWPMVFDYLPYIAIAVALIIYWFSRDDAGRK